MRGWARDLMDLVLPAACAGCGQPRTALCARCGAALLGRQPRRVRPVPEPPGLPVVHAAAPYGDEVRALLLAHKERGALGLAAPLGRALAAAVRAVQTDLLGVGSCPAVPASDLVAHRGRRDAADHDAARAAVSPSAPTWTPVPPGVADSSRWASPGARGGGWLLVPVPSARRAVRARGHDAARRIALAAAGELRRRGAPVRVLAALHQRRAVVDQSGLGPRQRWINLAGALRVTAGAGVLLRGADRVVLVDDLMTTGASLAEAARALRAAGVDGAFGAAVIAAPPGSFGSPCR